MPISTPYTELPDPRSAARPRDRGDARCQEIPRPIDLRDVGSPAERKPHGVPSATSEG